MPNGTMFCINYIFLVLANLKKKIRKNLFLFLLYVHTCMYTIKVKNNKLLGAAIKIFIFLFINKVNKEIKTQFFNSKLQLLFF